MGPLKIDSYGSQTPKDARGFINILNTLSRQNFYQPFDTTFDWVTDPALLVCKITISANHILNENDIQEEVQEQLNLFTDYKALEKQKALEDDEFVNQHPLQDVLLSIKKQFGKNAIFKAISWQEGTIVKNRNQQVGGHKDELLR